MIRRSLRILLEIAAALLAAAAIVFALLAWRLTQGGPIHLSFLSPYVERAVNDGSSAYEADIEDTILTWAGRDQSLDVRAIRLHIRDRAGKELALIPEASLSFSLRALLQGTIAPSKVEVLQPHLQIRRETDGGLAFGGRGETEAGSDEAFSAFLEDMLSPPVPGRPTSYLQSLSLRDGVIDLLDAASGRTWTASGVQLNVERGSAGVSGALQASLPQFGKMPDAASLIATARIAAGERRAILDAHLSGIALGSVAAFAPNPADFSGLDLTLDGNAQTIVGFDGSVGPIVFALTSRPAILALPDWLEEPAPLKELQVAGTIDRSHDLIRIDRARLDLDGPLLEASASWSGVFSGRMPDGGGPRLEAEVSLHRLPVSRLKTYWPKPMAADARAWVIPNITEGMVETADLALAARLPADLAGTELEQLSGSMKASGLVVHYLRPLPPITEGMATARFDAEHLEADITGGRVGEIKLESGAFSITGLEAKDQIIKVGGKAAAPVPAALALLDHPRLDYVKRLGIEPGNATGKVAADLSFEFPAKKDLDIDDVKIAVTADLAPVAIKKLRFDQDLTEGRLRIRLDNAGMDVTGPIVFAGMNLDLAWRQNFDDEAPFAERLHIVGKAGAAPRAALGFDFRPWLDGECQCDVTVTSFPNSRNTIEVKADLTQASLDLPFLKYRKEPGAEAKTAASLEMLGQQLAEISDFSLEAPELKAKGRADFDKDGELARVALPLAQFGRSDLLGLEIDLGEETIRASIQGGKLDAEPWLAEKKQEKTTAAIYAEEVEPQRPFALQGSLDQIRIAKDRWIAKAKFDLRHDPLWWDRIDVEARLQNGKSIVFKYAPAAPGTHGLSVVAEDGGETLRALDIFEGVKGGRLTITGSVKDDEPKRPVRGKLEMSSYRLVGAPFFARLFSLASVTGVIDIMTGEGYLFGGAKGRFTMTQGAIEIRKFRSAGPSIGLTANGKIDLDRDGIDLRGTITPAYLLNGLLSDIPIIGDILSGGGGEGIFSATYRVSGRLDKPDIDVNPLSVLTPGFLRDIFSDDGDGDGQPSAPRKPGNPPPNRGGRD